MIPLKTTEFANGIENGKTVGFTFNYYNKQNSSFVSSVIKKVLERGDLVYLQDTVVTVLRELIVNAVKANSKRYYFMKNNWDMSNTAHYLAGMQDFKKFIVANGESIAGQLKTYELRVDLYFCKTDQGFKIFVRNNTPIHSVEMRRIRERMAKAKQYNDFSEVYGELTDASEGEGLGLLLTILFLRNSGIGEDSLKIETDGKITQTTLTIPLTLKSQKITTAIQNKILAEIDSLPSLPKHIQEIEKLCAVPETPIKVISDKIVVDPSLAASVLRLANSAGFVTRSKAESIPDAIKVIGIRNLMAILSATSAKTAMDQRFKSYKKIWEHCNTVAFYSRAIAEKKKLSKIYDKVFLAGMLHDLGKIVLLSTSPDLDTWISDITKKREIRTSTVIEEISIGISHSTIGELIAQKWNMPEYVAESIKFHHSPVLCSQYMKEIVAIVYLANEMCNIESGKSSYQFLESDVLEMFGIGDKAAFDALHDDIKALPVTSVFS